MSVTKEKQIVIKAINTMGRRVSAADVATKTGLPVAKSIQVLNQIAEEASGHLQVSKVGDIAYQFPIGYQTAYISRGLKRNIEKFNNKLFEVGFFLLRISFGVMLILSLVTIVLLFFLIITATSRGRDSRDGDSGFNIDFDFFDWMILRDLLYWQTNISVYGEPVNVSPSNKSNFLYNCFSFLFGDGNPNADIDERRWQLIAQLIRQHKGVVTVEQLAPYTGNDPNNEDNVLPVLVRFDGRPVVTDSGSIVYLFPALQATAINQQRDSLPGYLKAYPWQFSKVAGASLVWVFVLAAINFLGTWYLYIQALSVLPTLTPICLALVIYGTLFVAVPLIRFSAIKILNTKIDQSNNRRKKYADELAAPNEALLKKLNEASQMPLDSRQIKADDLVYDTEKDLLEQNFPSINNS